MPASLQNWSQTFDFGRNDDSFVELGATGYVSAQTLINAVRATGNNQYAIADNSAEMDAAKRNPKTFAITDAGDGAVFYVSLRSVPAVPDITSLTGWTAPATTIPSYAALQGDVIDVAVTMGVSGTTFYSTELSNVFRSRLISNGFQVLTLDDSGVNYTFGGVLKLRLQITSNGYGNIQDAAGTIRGIAEAVGYRCLGASAEFVNKLRDNPSYKPTPSINPNGNPPPPVSTDFMKSLEAFFKSLTSSPVTLAAIILGVVILKRD